MLYKFVNPLSILIMQHNNNNRTYTTDKNKRNRTAWSYAPNFAYATAAQLQTQRSGKKKFTCTTTLFLPFVCKLLPHFVFCLLLLLLHHVSLCPIALYAHACNQRYSWPPFVSSSSAAAEDKCSIWRYLCCSCWCSIEIENEYFIRDFLLPAMLFI